MKLTLRLRNKVIDRYGARLEAMVNRVHSRLKKRIKTRLQAALGVDEDLFPTEEAQALRDYIESTVKVSYKLGRAQAASEGMDTTNSAGRHTQNLSRLTDEQMNYSRRLVDDQEAKANEIIRKVLAEEGNDTQEMTRRLEDSLGTYQSRARAIAVTETSSMYGNAYCDTLESNGINKVVWRRDPQMKQKAPCDFCDPLDGQVMTIMEFRVQFPAHTNCACWPEGYVEE
jgi:hypothetical protein